MIIATPPGYTFSPGGDLPVVTPEGVEVTTEQAAEIALLINEASPGQSLVTLPSVGSKPGGQVRDSINHAGSHTQVHEIKDTGTLVHKQKGGRVDGGRGVNIYDATGLYLGTITIQGSAVVITQNSPS